MPYWIAPLLGCAFTLVTMGVAVYSLRNARESRLNRIASQVTAVRVDAAVAEGARQVAAALVVRQQIEQIADRIREENEVTQPALAVPYGSLTAEVYDDGPQTMRGEAISGVVKASER